MGVSVSVKHAAALVYSLPRGAQTLAKIDPKSEWGDAEWLLLAILNSLREKPIDPWDTGEKQGFVADQDTYEALLSAPRKEVIIGSGN